MVKAHCNSCKRSTTMRVLKNGRMPNQPKVRVLTGTCTVCHGGMSTIASASAVRAGSMSPSPKKMKKSHGKKKHHKKNTKHSPKRSKSHSPRR